VAAGAMRRTMTTWLHIRLCIIALCCCCCWLILILMRHVIYTGKSHRTLTHTGNVCLMTSVRHSIK